MSARSVGSRCPPAPSRGRPQRRKKKSEADIAAWKAPLEHVRVDLSVLDGTAADPTPRALIFLLLR